MDTAVVADAYIEPAQLCVGLYVHLDLPWTRHPFTFSSFRIKDLEQVATIQSLGLDRVRYVPSKSEAQPLPPSLDAPTPPAPSPTQDAAYQAKTARLQRLQAQREKVQSCEREFLSATRTIRAINQNLFAQPEAVFQQADQLVRGIADSMLSDIEIAIQLMADKVGGEDVYFHSLNVTLLSMMLAKELKAPAEAVRVLGLGALFHDIGEMEIPERVARKTDPRTKAEQALYEMHCAYGITIGRKMGLPAEALVVVAQHHERCDGSGYPKKLQGNQISLLGRIVALVDAYDELCNPLNIHRALTPHEALSVLYAQQRDKFDATAMATFVRCMGVYPPGTLVMLSNGALGMVVSVNSSRPLKPTVLVYDAAVPKDEAIVVDLEQEPEVSISRTLRPEELPPDAHEYLAPRKRTAYYFRPESKPGAA